MSVARTPSEKQPEATGGADRARRARSLIDAARDRNRTDQDRRQADRARDAEWVERAKAGDSLAFRRLVETHQGRLFAVAFGIMKDRDEAMDVVQDAFIKVHKKLADFEGAAAFSTWLYRIAVNLCIDKKRAETRRRKADLDDAVATNLDEDSLYGDSEIAPRLSGANPLKTMGNKELGSEIGRALSTLTEEHRSILLLREVEGMSYEEISETLEIPKGTVMSRLFHARKNMQRTLRPFLGLDDEAGLDGKALEGRASGAAPDPVEDGRPGMRRKG